MKSTFIARRRGARLAANSRPPSLGITTSAISRWIAPLCAPAIRRASAAPCLNADGSADTNPAVTNPSQCTGSLQQNSGFVPLLAAYDLTRPGPGVGLYNYLGHADIKETALYIQDSITLKHLTLNLGLRGDLYYGISTARQAEPRVGAA